MSRTTARARVTRQSARSSWLRVLALCLLLPAARSHAAADCTVVATGVAFGVYDVTVATPDDSTGTLTVTCTYTGGGASNVSYRIGFSAGSSGTYTQRKMTAGLPKLGYNLYSDPARSVVLGDGSGGTAVFTGSFTVGPGVGNGTRTVTHTVYGRIPAQQPVDPGSFVDPIVVTLTF